MREKENHHAVDQGATADSIRAQSNSSASTCGPSLCMRLVDSGGLKALLASGNAGAVKLLQQLK